MTKVDIYDVVRENLKFYRKQKGLTQSKLSEAMGVCHDFVRQVESKKVNKNFSLANIQKAAEVLDIDFYKLFIVDINNTSLKRENNFVNN